MSIPIMSSFLVSLPHQIPALRCACGWQDTGVFLQECAACVAAKREQHRQHPGGGGRTWRRAQTQKPRQRGGVSKYDR